MPDHPLGFHITFGSYGMRLHGDERGTVDRSMNRPGDPIVGRDEDWQRLETSRMTFPPMVLTRPQRAVAEGVLPEVCRQGKWTFHIAAAKPDHVHLLMTAQRDAESKITRRLVKRWLSEQMSRRWRLPPGARWWAIGGSVKWVWDQRYFDNVWNYIYQQQVIRSRR